ncbi:MAG: OsmC family protein [Microbacteriaceae bacterium]
MAAVVTAGSFEIAVDEPKSAGGADTGPQPTDIFLASIASCFTLAMAYAARKSRIDLPGLSVETIGTYRGQAFSQIDVLVHSDAPADVVAKLIPVAERVCYVTNTLRGELTLRIAPAADKPDRP